MSLLTSGQSTEATSRVSRIEAKQARSKARKATKATKATTRLRGRARPTPTRWARPSSARCGTGGRPSTRRSCRTTRREAFRIYDGESAPVSRGSAGFAKRAVLARNDAAFESSTRTSRQRAGRTRASVPIRPSNRSNRSPRRRSWRCALFRGARRPREYGSGSRGSIGNDAFAPLQHHKTETVSNTTIIARVPDGRRDVSRSIEICRRRRLTSRRSNARHPSSPAASRRSSARRSHACASPLGARLRARAGGASAPLDARPR